MQFPRSHLIRGNKFFLMELLMKIKFKILTFLALTMSLAACGGGMSSQARQAAASGLSPERYDLRPQTRTAQMAAVRPQMRNSLDELAALERAGSWFQGMALAEAGLREEAGDFAGAVAAAYKELSWAYGKGLIQKEEVEQGLLNLLALKSEDALESAQKNEAALIGESTVKAAANAALAFAREQWAGASAALEPLFDGFEEPDGFGRWMILVCALEKNREDRRAGAAYKAIRARYVQFPEYWYRGARAFPGIEGAEYAENCINSSPQGPFADECRRQLASFTGLKGEDGASIKTKTEIEAIISQSLKAGNPQLLDSLFPLIGLPDNPYTVYAVGALRALTSVPKFRDYFNGQAASSRGRLAERLSYICRG